MNSTLLSSEERTATTATLDQTSPGNQCGVLLVLDVTKAPAAADTLTVSVEVRDPATGKYIAVTAFDASKKGEELSEGATLSFQCSNMAASTTVSKVKTVDFQRAQTGLPSAWRAKVTHSAEGKWTYTLGALALR